MRENSSDERDATPISGTCCLGATSFPPTTGSGVEYALAQNWILGVEYRHYEFDTKSVTSTTTNFGGFTEPVRFDGKTDVVMGRVSYKFNWASPVVAKY